MPITTGTLRLATAERDAQALVLDELTSALIAGWADSWGRLELSVESAVHAALRAVPQGQSPSRVQLQRDSRLQGVLARMIRETIDLLTRVRTEANVATRKITASAYDVQDQIITSQLPPGRKVAEESRATDLASLIARTASRVAVLTRVIPGKVDLAIRAALLRASSSGGDPEVVAQRMIKSAEETFTGGLTRSLIAVRTELADAQRAAAAAAQWAQRDVLTGWIWLSRLDRDTCPACFSMHGTEHPLSETGPNGHQQCHCTRAPKTKTWAELGFSEFPEPPDELLDAQQVFRSMPRADQLRIMGSARLSALDNGDLTWDRLHMVRENPGWRSSYVSRPVSRSEA